MLPILLLSQCCSSVAYVVFILVIPRTYRKQLQPECHRMIFNRDKEIAKDSSGDFSLKVTCKAMIDQYCENSDDKDLLECLKPFIDHTHFDHRSLTHWSLEFSALLNLNLFKVAN